jgi:hypothetical protein
VGNIPDIGETPALQFELTHDFGIPPALLPAVLQNITAATEQANAEIQSFAAGHHIPVIDLFGLGHVVADAPTHPVTVGGEQVSDLYSPDFFHPNTVGQGLLGDAAVEALATAYNPGLDRFRLTDQQILDDAHIAHAPGHSFFDVSPFVLFSEQDGGHHGSA